MFLKPQYPMQALWGASQKNVQAYHWYHSSFVQHFDSVTPPTSHKSWFIFICMNIFSFTNYSILKSSPYSSYTHSFKCVSQVAYSINRTDWKFVGAWIMADQHITNVLISLQVFNNLLEWYQKEIVKCIGSVRSTTSPNLCIMSWHE